MAEIKAKKPLINLKAIAKDTGIPYMKLYNCSIGKYQSLTDSEKTSIKECVSDEVQSFFVDLQIV